MSFLYQQSIFALIPLPFWIIIAFVAQAGKQKGLAYLDVSSTIQPLPAHRVRLILHESGIIPQSFDTCLTPSHSALQFKVLAHITEHRVLLLQRILGPCAQPSPGAVRQFPHPSTVFAI